MKKLLSYIFIIILTTTISCEIDDICIEDSSTPKLIIKFFDANDSNIAKEVENLYVWAKEKDSLYQETTTDSIAIPLNPSTSIVEYCLSTNSIIDTLKIHYTNQEVFISRSCGYKMNFTIQDETQLLHHWASGFETTETPQIIENEQETHLKIYH